MQINDLLASLNGLLHPENYHDYAPNGLQVAGHETITRIVTGVSANQALINAARDLHADAIVVHHGWFWKNDDPRIVGVSRKRIASLLAADMALLAYHLPLDDHPTLGNNALLGERLQLTAQSRFGENSLGWLGTTRPYRNALELGNFIARQLNRAPVIVGPTEHPVNRVAWCSGAAQDMLEQAFEAGADCFISGEISERTTALAQELGIAYLCCGHHATETLGIHALGDWIAREHGLDVTFVDIANPI